MKTEQTRPTFFGRMGTKKVRRESGRETPDLTLDIPVKIAVQLCLEPQPQWNDWNDYRDGFRGSGDKTLIGDNIGYGHHMTPQTISNKKRIKDLENRRRLRQKSPRNQKL